MLKLDPSNLRDWLAAVGVLRLVSEVTDTGSGRWISIQGRYAFQVSGAPEDLAERCAKWVNDHRSAWRFGGLQNVNFGPGIWREFAATTTGIEAALWCALGSDVVLHRDGKKVRASGLEFGHGGGHQHWLESMRASLEAPLTAAEFTRVLGGGRDDSMKTAICRWDSACERQHAYRASDPAKDKMTQDGVLNALAAIGLASCPSMPRHGQLVTPLVHDRGVLRWPIWTEELRLADLEAMLLCGWTCPTMQGRRWLAGKLYCFSGGELREPESSAS